MQKRIFVPPFENLTKNSNDDYLQNAISNEIIHLLTQYRTIRVVSDTYSKLGSFEELKKGELNIDHILKGAFLKVNNRIRINFQLINFKDKTCMVSTNFEENQDNVFQLIDNISRKIVDILNLEILNSNQSKINPLAYDFYLKGMHHWNLWNEDNIEQAIFYFNEALKIEPENSTCYAKLSFCWSMLATINVENVEENYSLAKQAALKSIELDDTLIDAHLSLFLIKLFQV